MMNEWKWQGRWIWNDGEASPRNEWHCFRKSFRLEEHNGDNLLLSLTADSRYVLYVNGKQIGRGPVRSWPSEQAYDTYDLTDQLQVGKMNTIAVLVMHFGVSTYSYVRGRGGLIAELNAVTEGKAHRTLIATDGSWKTHRHEGQDSRAPRMSFQLAFSERIDGRLWDDGWMTPDYDDSGWPDSVVIGPAGMEPWTSLVPRDIPPLEESIVYPARVHSLHEVVPVSYTTIIDTRSQMAADSAEHMNAYGYAGYVATVIRLEESGTAKLGLTYRPPNVHCVLVNGRRFTKEDLASGEIELTLEQGENLLMVELIGHDHGRGLFLALDSEQPFELISPIKAGTGMSESPFVSVGPFHRYEYIDHRYGEIEQSKHHAALCCGDHDRTDPSIDGREQEDYETFVRLGSVSRAEELAAFGERVRPIPEKFVSREAIISLMQWKRKSVEHAVPQALQQLVMPHQLAAEVPLYPNADTEIIIDFGQELSGFVSFEIDAGEGTVIDLYGFEYMRDGWIQHMHYLENAIRYVCREGRQRVESQVRRGFRYAILTVRQAVRPVRIYDVHTILSHYPVAETGQFQSSDPLLDEIWSISQHTTKLCMEDTFVDCPSFEQAFWVGDSRNEALIAYYLFGSEDLIKRCLRLVPGSRELTPLYIDQVPSGFNSVIPNWTFFWVHACLEYYVRTGEREFVTEMWPHVRYTLDHYLEHLDERGLLNMHGWNFLDWAPIDQPRYGVVSHQNMFLVQALRSAAELSAIAGDAEGSARFAAQANSLKAAINMHLWSDERQAYLDCIHGDGRRSDVFSMQTQVVALLCKIADEERRPRLEQWLETPPEAFVPIGSPFMSFFYYEALSMTGKFDRMLSDIREQYGRMIEYGATTCWEMYPKPDKNGQLPKQPTRSHCHAWSAAPPYFLGAYVLGVRSAEPGWTEVTVEPQPGDLTWARGSVPLPRAGSIDVSWVVSGDHEMTLRIRSPKGVNVRARLPEGYTGSIEHTHMG